MPCPRTRHFFIFQLFLVSETICFCNISSHCSMIKMDLRLLNRPSPVSWAGLPTFLCPDTQHWGPPGSCVESPAIHLIHSQLHPSSCSIFFIKFADHTTVVRLLHHNDESADRDEIPKLSTWCSTNNLSLNTSKIKEVVVDFRRKRTDLAQVYINGDAAERFKDFKFLGTHISQDFTWATNTTGHHLGNQHHSPCEGKHGSDCTFSGHSTKPTSPRSCFYPFTTVLSKVSFRTTFWFSCCTAADKKVLDRVRKSAQHIIHTHLPSLTDIYHTRCLHWA